MSAWYRPYVEDAANEWGVSADLIDALIRVESGGNQWAWNPEPRYRYLWDVKRNQPFRAVTPAEIASETPPKDFPTLAADPDQEWWAQQASWGLMQVMGAVARELGFRGPFLSQLCAPHTGIEYGCKKLSREFAWAGGDYAKALGAYNAGRGGWNSTLGKKYAAKVLAQLEKVKAA